MGAHTTFEKVFNLLKEYKEEHGHCNVPVACKVGTVNLGKIVANIKKGYRKTTADQKAMLDSIDFVWDVKEQTSFEEVFRLLQEYKAEYKHCVVPLNYKIGTVNLGWIVSTIRSGDRKITDEQKAMLESIGFVWHVHANANPSTFEEVFILLIEYKNEHRHCNVPQDEKVGTINFGIIVKNIRSGNRKITDEQKAMLDSIGFVWKVNKYTTFEEVFRLLQEYKAEYKHCDVPYPYKIGTVNLGRIVSNIRCGNRKTTPEQKAMLDSIGFVWEVRNNK